MEVQVRDPYLESWVKMEVAAANRRTPRGLMRKER